MSGAPSSAARRRWLRGAGGLALGAGGLMPGAGAQVLGAAPARAARTTPVVGAPATDAADGPAASATGAALRLVADFDPVAAVWLGFGDGHDALTVGLAAALQPHVPLAYLLRDEADRDRLVALLRAHGLATERLRFLHDPAAGYFTRDLGVFARSADGRPAVVDFRATLYGTATWCRNRYAHDAAAAAACTAHGEQVAAGRTKVDRAIARHLGAAVHPTPLAAEGGGIEVNGRGLLIANEPFWASRNPELTRAQLERALLALPGVRKLIWLPDGLAEDVHLRGTITGEFVAWGAGGHTDQFVRFADERTVLLAWPDDARELDHPVVRLTRRRMQRNFEILRAATDERGRRLRVLRVPMPTPVERRVVLDANADASWPDQWTPEFFPPRERRREGQTLRQVATATYLNFVVANDALVLPDYVPHGTPPARQRRVQRLFEQAFPGRRVSFVDAISANWVGGGLHCATLNQP